MRDATWSPAAPYQPGDACRLLVVLPSVLGGFQDCTEPGCGEKVTSHVMVRSRPEGFGIATMPTARCDSHRLRASEA